MRKHQQELPLNTATNYKTDYKVTIDTTVSRSQKSAGYSAHKQVWRYVTNALLVLIALTVALVLFQTYLVIATVAFIGIGIMSASAVVKAYPFNFLQRFKAPRPQTVSKTSRPVAKLRTRATRVLAVLILATVGFGAIAQPASADPVTDKLKALACPAPGIGSDPMKPGIFTAKTGLDENGNQRNIKLTGWEVYGMSPSWTAYDGIPQGNIPDSISNAKKYDDRNAIFRQGECVIGLSGFSTNAIWNGIANGIFGVTKVVVYIDILIVHYSLSGQALLTDGLLPTFVALVTQLKASLFDNLALPIIMASGIIVLITYMRKKHTIAIQQIGWILASLIIGGIVLSAPEIAVKVPLSVVNSTAGGISAGIVSGGTSAINSAEIDNTCQISVGDNNSFINNDRQVSCLLWDTFIKQPYIQGQFGSNPSALTQNLNVANGDNPEGRHIPDASLGGGITSSPRNWANIQLGLTTQLPGDAPEATLEKRSDFHLIADAQLGRPTQGGDGNVNTDWETSGINRCLIAVMSLIGAVIAGIPIVIMGIKMIVFVILLMVFMAFLPFVLTVGIFPGFGMKLIRNYFGWLGEITLFQGFHMVYFSLTIATMSAIMKVTGSDFLTGILLLTVASIASMVFYKRILKMLSLENAQKAFNTVQSAMKDPVGVNKLKKATSEIAIPIAMGNVAGAMGAASKLKDGSTATAQATRVAPTGLTTSKDAPKAVEATSNNTASNGNSASTPMGSNNRVTPDIATDKPASANQPSTGTKSNAGNGNTASTATQKAHILKGYDNRVTPTGWGSDASMETASAQVAQGAVRSPAGATNGATSGQEAPRATETPASPAKASGSDTQGANRPQETVITREVIVELPTQRSSGTTQQSQASSGTSRASQQASSSPEPEPAKAKVSMLPTKSDKPAQNQSVTFQAKLPDNSVASGSQGGLPKRSQSLPKAGGSGTSRPSR